MIYPLITIDKDTPIERAIKRELQRAGVHFATQETLFDQSIQYSVFSSPDYYKARLVLYHALNPRDRDRLHGHPRDQAKGASQ